MLRKVHRWALSSLLFSSATAYAVDAVYVDGVGLEAQGFAGRMPLLRRTSPSTQRLAVACDGTTVYYLDSLSGITRYSLATSARLGSFSTGAILTDIAVTDGQLYGVVNRADALQIVRINPNGTTTSVLNRPNVPGLGNWNLSGAVGGSQLLAVRYNPVPGAAPGAPATFPVTLFDPATLATSQFTMNSDNGPILGNYGLGATVIKADASSFAVLPNTVQYVKRPDQPQFHLPDGSALPSRTQFDNYASSANPATFNATTVSDEFTYSFGPSNNAIAITSLTGDNTNWNRLYRRPFLWTGAATAILANGIAPDGTTLTDVAATAPFNITGPVPLQANVTVANPGPFAERTLGTGNFSLDLNTAPRGLYTVGAKANLTAIYNHDGLSGPARPINLSSWATRQFAYDPVSPNLVGNSDLELSHFGWERSYSSAPDSWSAAAVASDGPNNNAAWLTPSSNSYEVLRQVLELGTPNSPLLLSFDCRLDPFSTSTNTKLEIFLNSRLPFTWLMTRGDSYSHFDLFLDNPAYMNLTNPELRFKVTTPSGFAWVYIDNISLTAVPEPASLSLGLLLAATLARRRPRRTPASRFAPIPPRTLAHEPLVA